MHVDNLFLEITRMCNLECEHCLRGDRRKEFMSTQTIESAFKGVSEVGTLLLTGGEPLIAIKQIKDVIRVIKENNIKVNRIILVTNGTVLSDNVVSVLEELSKIGEFTFEYSNDVFHQLEMNKLGLLKKVRENVEYFKDRFNCFPEVSSEDPDLEGIVNKEKSQVVHKLLLVGRAKKLTKERKKEINSMVKGFNYIYVDDRILGIPVPYYVESNNSIMGKVSVDVHGNVVGYEQSYDEEDAETTLYSSNINELGLLRAVLNNCKYYTEYLKTVDCSQKVEEVQTILLRAMHGQYE